MPHALANRLVCPQYATCTSHITGVSTICHMHYLPHHWLSTTKNVTCTSHITGVSTICTCKSHHCHVSTRQCHMHIVYYKTHHWCVHNMPHALAISLVCTTRNAHALATSLVVYYTTMFTTHALVYYTSLVVSTICHILLDTCTAMCPQYATCTSPSLV